MKIRNLILLALFSSIAFSLVSCGDDSCQNHKDENNDGKCDICETEISPPKEPEEPEEPKEPENPKDPEDQGAGITLQKFVSVLPSKTVNLGEVLTYTVRVQNASDKEKNIDVTDTVPTNASYVSGADGELDGKLSWCVALAVGESRDLTYTVKVSDDISLYTDGILSSEKACVGSKSAECYPIYIRRTLTESDAVYLDAAMNALNDSSFKDQTLLKWIYQVAFSKSITLTSRLVDTLDKILDAPSYSNTELRALVAPTLYGGSAVTADTDEKMPGARAANVEEGDFVFGDALIVESADEERIFIFNRIFFELTDGMAAADGAEVFELIKNSERFVVLRPSMSMPRIAISGGKTDVSELNEYQKMLLKTAEAYLLRGERIQYDDSRLASVRVNGERPEFRWQKGFNAPEDYASDRWGYTNCAAFCHDVYLYGLGYEINVYTTAAMASSMSKQTVLFHMNNKAFTDEEKAYVRKMFEDSLEIGDLIVVRRSNGSGHVMLYVGDGRVIHSSGSSYNYNTSAETYEPSIRYMDIYDYLFTPGASNNVCEQFSKKYVSELYVIRPLLDYTEKIDPQSVARVTNLSGIRAEKVSSYSRGRTVNPGDEITFNFNLFNSGETEKTVEISDVVPENTEFVSVNGGNHTEGILSFTIVLASGESKTVSYTVKVSDVEYGTAIYSDKATINGVVFRCPEIYVKKTLTADEKSRIKSAIASFVNKSDNTLFGIDLANAIYAAAGLEAPFADADFESVVRGVLEYAEGATADSSSEKENTNVVRVSINGEYRDMLVDGAFGGRYLYTETLEYLGGDNEGGIRTRLLRSHNLEVGDVIIARVGSGTPPEKVLIYDGEALYDISSSVISKQDTDPRLARLLAYQHYFMVLRPSMTNDELS